MSGNSVAAVGFISFAAVIIVFMFLMHGCVTPITTESQLGIEQEKTKQLQLELELEKLRAAKGRAKTKGTILEP